MTRGRWAALAIALAILVPAGFRWRERARFAADRAALRAELLDSIAARERRPWPAVEAVPDEENAALLWQGAVKAVAAGSVTQEFEEQVAPEREWDGVTKLVAEVLAANAGAFALADEAARRPRCAFQESALFTDVSRPLELINLLKTRGRAAAAAGDLRGAVGTASTLRRMARDFAHPPPDGDTFAARLSSVWADCCAFLVLRGVAVHRGLDEESARAALEAARPPWRFDIRGEEGAGRLRAAVESRCVELLDPDPEAALEAAGFGRRDAGERLKRLIHGGGGGDDDDPRAPPSADEIRRALAHVEAVEVAEARGDREALRPSGSLHRADLGEEGAAWAPSRFLETGLADSWIRMGREALAEAVRGTLALRLHEVRAGRPADSWADIVPGILEAPPRDPFTGGPLEMETTPAGGVVSARPWAGTYVWPSAHGSMSVTIDPVRVEWKR